jgi:hypothetical protein
LKVKDENRRIWYGSGSINLRHESADPDPHQNVMDPQHWVFECEILAASPERKVVSKVES